MPENKTVPFSFVKAGVFTSRDGSRKTSFTAIPPEKYRSGYGQDQRRSLSPERKELLSNSMNTGTTYASKT